MRCCCGSSCREWYFDLPRCASISRQLLLRLPENPPPSSSRFSRAMSCSCGRPGPEGLESFCDEGCELPLLLIGKRRLLVRRGLKDCLLRPGRERVRNIGTGCVSGERGRVDATASPACAQLEQSKKLEEDLPGSAINLIACPALVKPGQQRVLPVLERMVEARPLFRGSALHVTPRRL